MKQTVILIVLDGWGLGKDDESNPIYAAKTENFKFLEKNYPMTSLNASGIGVGLPWGETGNSEVGHLTLGAGRVVYQYFPRITLAIRDGSFFENPAIKGAFEHAKKNNSAVNLTGLLTRANVHASLDHVLTLLQMAEKEGVSKVNLHLFADGKDSPPHTLERFLNELPKEKFATLTGRYYAMDRKGEWKLTERAYNCLVGKEGKIINADDLPLIIKTHYQKDLIEEFLPAFRFGPDKKINDGDALIFFNFREDSIKQLAESFILKDFDKFPRVDFKNLYITTFTKYDDRFDMPVAFPPQKVEKCLGEALSDAGKTQLRLAESYKYAHITYFFNGHREAPFKNEYWILIPSLSGPHPEDHPELQAAAITERLVEAINDKAFDFILVNYANPDTIGHTGNYPAAIETARVVDREIGRVLKAADDTGAIILITSDHGNLEQIVSPQTGTAETQHDPNPVPLHLIGTQFKGRRFPNWQTLKNETIGMLSDVAPTVLEIMGIPKPKEMDGRSLLRDLI